MSKKKNKIEQADESITESLDNKYMTMYYNAKSSNDLPAQVFALECRAVSTVSKDIWPEEEMKEEEVIDFVNTELKGYSGYLPKKVIESIHEVILSYSGIEPEVLAIIEDDIGIVGNELDRASLLGDLSGE